jgi:hypothetical protein
MLQSLRRWKARHLVAAWSAYWVGLVLVKLAEPIRIAWRLTRLPDNHGTISASYADGLLKITMIQDGVTQYAGSVSFAALALWIAGPPLVMFVLWLMIRPRPITQMADDAPAALGAGEFRGFEASSKRDERVPLERDR